MTRKKPYTEIGIQRMKCVRCGSPAKFQWQICADGNTWRPLCGECDVGMNAMVLRYVFGQTREDDIAKYAEFVLGHNVDTKAG